MIRVVLATAFAAILVAPAPAAVIYELSFAQTNVSVDVGQSLTLDIFFSETATGGDPHRLDLAAGTFGLTTANFRVTNMGPGGSTITGIAGNALFDGFGGPDPMFADPLASVQQDVDFFSNPVFATTETLVTGGTMRSVQVGSLTMMASNLLGAVNVFQLSDFGLGTDFVIDDGFGGLAFEADGVMSFGSVTLTTVPEPSSWALFGLAGVISAYRLRRKQRKSHQAPDDHTASFA